MLTVDVPIENFPAQQEIFNHPSKYKIVAKGRRFGLTRGAANDFILCALERRFTQGVWVDTVQSNIDRYVERYFIPSLKNLPKSMWNWKKQEKSLFILDSYIDFRSAERPENIEGFGYDKAFLNEAGIILSDPYLWNNAIRPMLWEFKPQTVVGGTPKGRNLFWELYQRGLDPNQDLYKSFHFTSFDNPWYIPEDLKKEMESMPEMVIQQEIYAQFLEDSGVVFRGVTKIAKAEPKKPIIGNSYVMGVDLAKVQDYTVIVVYDRSTNAQVFQKRIREIDWPYQKKQIAEIARHYNNALVYLDATGLGDPIADDLLRDGVAVEPYKLTNQSKKELIEKLAIYIEQERINILNIPETIAELTNFTYDVSNSGRIMYNSPAGFHDDIVIAHALAVWGLDPINPKEKPSEPVSLIRQEYLKRLRGDSDEYYI